jgi:hypothetical protein
MQVDETASGLMYGWNLANANGIIVYYTDIYNKCFNYLLSTCSRYEAGAKAEHKALYKVALESEISDLEEKLLKLKQYLELNKLN